MTHLPPHDQTVGTPLPYAVATYESPDEQHLKLLSIFHFIVGGLVMLFGLFPVVYIVMGAMIYSGNFNSNNDPNARWVGLLFMAIGGGFVVIAWALGILAIVAGLQLRRHRRWTLCMVAASALCVFLPFGTVLGVFSIVVLMRPSVRPLFS